MTRIAPAAAPKPAFDDLAPFPGENRATIGHNRAPLEEQIVIDLETALDEVPNLRARMNDVLAKADSLPACTSEEMAGKLGDFAKIATTCAAVIDSKREEIKRPVLTAGRNLDAKARAYTDALNAAALTAKGKVTVWINEEREKERKRLAEEQAKRDAEEKARREAEAAAAAAGRVIEPEPEPVYQEVAPARAKPAPMATGDYGARVGTTTRWVHEPVASVKGLPKEVMGHPKVIEAVNTVIAGMVRTGTRELKGVVIKQETVASIR